jgi:hypothetical protein
MGSRTIRVSLEGAAEQPAGQGGDPDARYSTDDDPQKLVDGKLARYHKISQDRRITSDQGLQPCIALFVNTATLAASGVADAERGRARKDMGSCAGMLRPDVWFSKAALQHPDM